MPPVPPPHAPPWRPSQPPAVRRNRPIRGRRHRARDVRVEDRTQPAAASPLPCQPSNQRILSSRGSGDPGGGSRKQALRGQGLNRSRGSAALVRLKFHLQVSVSMKPKTGQSQDSESPVNVTFPWLAWWSFEYSPLTTKGGVTFPQGGLALVRVFRILDEPASGSARCHQAPICRSGASPFCDTCMIPESNLL